MKRPAFQFYPADWRKDVELRSCSIASRGLWIDMLCIAHECDPYGHLTINGKAMTAAQIAGQVGLTAPQAQKLIDELKSNGVARVTAEGVIYSKRMVDDEDLRNRRAAGGKDGAEHGIKGAEAGSKGGRPKKGKGGFETPLPGFEEPPPSSSSSSSTSVDTPQPPKGGCRRFEEFWTAWPKSERKQDKVKCAEKWRRADLDLLAEVILADIAVKRQTQKWRDGYLEAPLVYLNGRRWEDGVTPGGVDAEPNDWTAGVH